MKHTPLAILLLVAFALTMGDYASRVWQPSTTSEYSVVGEFRPMGLSSADGLDTKAPPKHLYLRRTLLMTAAPERAWLRVIGHDIVQVFVNGRKAKLSKRVSAGRLGSVQFDATPLLHAGENVIAIHAMQLVRDRPPRVVVQGECAFANGELLTIDNSTGWLANWTYDRRGLYWYEVDFPDDHWTTPVLDEPVVWRAQVEMPPRAISEPFQSNWITTSSAAGGSAVVAREFELPGRPTEGWARVSATGPMRVAVNGSVIVRDDESLGLDKPQRIEEKTIDISPFLQSGSNTISVVASQAGATPRFRIDAEATTSAGVRVRFGSDAEWRGAAGDTPNWHHPDLSSTAWNACQSEAGYLGRHPRSLQRTADETEPAAAFWLARAVFWAGSVLACGLFAWLGCVVTKTFLDKELPEQAGVLPYLALAPTTALALTGHLMTWDYAWTSRDIYQPVWFGGMLLLVLIQWAALPVLAVFAGWFKSQPKQASRPAADWWPRVAMVSFWVLLVAFAAWLRLDGIADEAIHHDEVTAYFFTLSVLQNGFPGGQVHPDIPFGYCATSEISFYPTALFALFVEDPRLVIRLPSVLWSLATLLLIGHVGRRWFNPYVGGCAAFLFAVAPHVVRSAAFGRYLSEVQFFALLTTYLAYEAMRGTGKPRTGYLWGSAFSIVAMYLSWEGSGVLGVGIALAVLLERRRSLRPVLTSPHLYFSTLFVVVCVAAQYAHRVMQQTQRLWYGEGISSLSMQPMWRLPLFDADFFLLNSSWTRDAIIPMAAVAVACLLAVRHRWRSPIRFTLICLLTNAQLMSMLLPLRTNRYSYHLTQFTILLAAVVAVALAEQFIRVSRGAGAPFLRRYGGVVAAVTLLIAAGPASGWLLRTRELTSFTTAAFETNQLRSPDWEVSTKFLLENMREGDVVISIFPHTQNFLFHEYCPEGAVPETVDYWLESRLVLQATVGDSRSVPLDRRSGAVMLYDLDQLKRVFEEHERVWYCTMRYGQSKINTREVSQYLRENMDVVYEDYLAAVMLHDANHRPAEVRLEEQESGRVAGDFYLK